MRAIWGLLKAMWKQVFSLADKADVAWDGFKPNQKSAVVTGVGIALGAYIGGPAVFPFAMGGILVNTMFWWLVKDSSNLMCMMRRNGAVIDIVLTVGSFFLSGGVFSTWMMMLLATSYFTIFRKVLAPPYEKGEVPSLWSRFKMLFRRRRLSA